MLSAIGPVAIKSFILQSCLFCSAGVINKWVKCGVLADPADKTADLFGFFLTAKSAFFLICGNLREKFFMLVLNSLWVCYMKEQYNKP